MLRRFNRARYFAIITLSVISIYVFAMIVLTAIFCQYPGLVFVNQVSADIPNPFEGGDYDNGDIKNYSEIFKQFEGYVILASNVESGSHDLHLFALPGQNAQIYRNFTLFIFTNQPCYYEVKIDDQVYQRGYSEWKALVKSSSPYTTMNIVVTLKNETNATLPLFEFKNIKLLDSPWEAQGGEEEVPVVEEWIRFSRGEFTWWVIRGIALQLGFAFLGIVSGTAYASIHADTRGINRVI